MKRYKYFIGIDVSKLTLDFAIMSLEKLIYHRKVANDDTAIASMLIELKGVSGFKISNSVFGMEHTGVYCNKILSALQRTKASIVYENPSHIKNSLGSLRGKNDKLDSIRIATYLKKSKDDLRLWQGKRRIIQELASLVALRDRLSRTKRALKTPLKEDQLFVCTKFAIQNEKFSFRSIQALEADIDMLDDNIKLLCSSDPKIDRMMDIITSIPCIGHFTALQMIITSNEFETINGPKQFAAYAGLAPYPKQSGTGLQYRNRVSNVANKKMKTLLHTCAMLSNRFVPEMQAYFKKKTEIEGKPKMLVFNAIRSKLVLRVFSCIKQDRLYTKDYCTNNEDLNLGAKKT